MRLQTKVTGRGFSRGIRNKSKSRSRSAGAGAEAAAAAAAAAGAGGGAGERELELDQVATLVQLYFVVGNTEKRFQN
jgi:hypothetical protein